MEDDVIQERTALHGRKALRHTHTQTVEQTGKTETRSMVTIMCCHGKGNAPRRWDWGLARCVVKSCVYCLDSVIYGGMPDDRSSPCLGVWGSLASVSIEYVQHRITGCLEVPDDA